MSHLNLQYRCNELWHPLFLSRAEVEELAGWARQQLVAPEIDLIPLSVLKNITSLTINRLPFNLWVDTDHTPHDEQGAPVLGVCEFDPDGSPNTAIVSVTPVSPEVSEEVVRSTVSHELGHAIFDAPGWITASTQRDLFDSVSDTRKAYRTTTQDANHMFRNPETSLEREVRFAEMRANEFMGSVLVPRNNLLQAVDELAPQHRVGCLRENFLIDEISAGTPRLIDEDHGRGIPSLQRNLAKRFGVHRRFIEVRMGRYQIVACS